MDTYNEWNIVKQETQQGTSNIKIRTGEVRWCRFGINIGNEIIGKGDSFLRPVIIIKKFSGDVFLGLPLTTKVHTGDWYYTVTYDGSPKSIILNQSRVLDKKRLEEKIIELSPNELLEIKKAYCNLIMSI